MWNFLGFVQSFEAVLKAIYANILIHHRHRHNFHHCHLPNMWNHQETIHFLRCHLNPTSSSRRIFTPWLRNWLVQYTKLIQNYKAATLRSRVWTF